MNINTEFNIQDFVYMTTDSSQKLGQVTGLFYDGYCIKYEVTVDDLRYMCYDYQITTDKNILL